MNKSINIPFKLPFARKSLKWVADFFNIEIIEKVSAPKAPDSKMSATTFYHTIPQQRIDTRASERRNKDGVEIFKNKTGFYMKGGREGYIYYVESSKKVCECYYEMSGVSDYDILISVEGLTEWFLPTKKMLSESEKNEIISKMKTWLIESKIKANFY